MKYGIRSMKFWSRQCLSWLAISVLAALFLLILQSMGSESPAIGSFYGFFMTAPFYVISIGAFCGLILSASTFQTMFSVLVSMNATRKAVILGIMLTQAVFILCILAVSAGLWGLGLAQTGEGGEMLTLLPLFAAVCFVLAAVGSVVGVVFLRWGKAGVIAMVIICGITGGIIGALFARTDGKLGAAVRKIMLDDLAGRNFWPFAAGSVLVFAAAAVFALVATRKAEVKS